MADTDATPEPGTRDGSTAGDNDRPYKFGDHFSTRAHGPFSTIEFARLLCLRSHVQDGDRVPKMTEPTIVVAVGAPACFDDKCPDCKAFLASVDAA